MGYIFVLLTVIFSVPDGCSTQAVSLTFIILGLWSYLTNGDENSVLFSDVTLIAATTLTLSSSGKVSEVQITGVNWSMVSVTNLKHSVTRGLKNSHRRWPSGLLASPHRVVPEISSISDAMLRVSCSRILTRVSQWIVRNLGWDKISCVSFWIICNEASHYYSILVSVCHLNI